MESRLNYLPATLHDRDVTQWLRKFVAAKKEFALSERHPDGCRLSQHPTL